MVAAGAAAPRLVKMGLAVVVSVTPSWAAAFPEASVVAPVRMVPPAGALSVLRCTGSDGHADALIALDGHLPAEVELRGDIGGRGPYLGRLVVAEEKGQGKHGKGANHGDDNRQLGQAEAALPSPVTAPGTSDSHGPPGDIHAR
jgi:hypothetical protein